MIYTPFSGPPVFRKPSDNIEGHISGRLTARRAIGKSSQGTVWLCDCECGNTTCVTAGHFNCGDTLSCGCYLKEKIRSRKKPANDVVIFADIARIRLEDRYGGERGWALVDVADLELVRPYRWYMTDEGYVAAHVGYGTSRRAVQMHRIILGLPPGLSPEVDHVNGRPADNCRSNLRTCTRTENNHNCHAVRSNTGYKGVHFNKRQRKFVAYITVNGQMKYLGQYVTPEAGALAYNRAAREHYGEFACLNRVKLVLNKRIPLEAGDVIG